MAKVTKKVTKKRVKKNVERGQAHIQSSFNNTIVTLTDAQGKDKGEEYDGEHDGGYSAYVGHDGHFVGGGCGAGDGDHGTDAEDEGAHEHCRGHLAEARGDRLAAADTQQSENGKHRKTDVGDEIRREAAEPVGTCLDSEVGRENYVACSEEHRKQRKSDDDNVTDTMRFLQIHLLSSLFFRLIGLLLSFFFMPAPSLKTPCNEIYT